MEAIKTKTVISKNTPITIGVVILILMLSGLFFGTKAVADSAMIKANENSNILLTVPTRYEFEDVKDSISSIDEKLGNIQDTLLKAIPNR